MEIDKRLVQIFYMLSKVNKDDEIDIMGDFKITFNQFAIYLWLYDEEYKKYRAGLDYILENEFGINKENFKIFHFDDGNMIRFNDDVDFKVLVRKYKLKILKNDK